MPAQAAQCARVVVFCQGQQVGFGVRGSVDHVGWECVDGGHDDGGLFGVDHPLGQGRVCRRMGFDGSDCPGPDGWPRRG